MRRLGSVLSALLLAGALAGCAGEQTPGVIGGSGESSGSADASKQPAATEGQQFPDVQSAELTATGEERTFDVAVTISSPYDTPERYADGWRLLASDGTVLGEHELTHDHASEQPFTRTQYDLQIPEGVDEVTVEGRDLVNGFGGETVTVEVPS